MISITHEVAIKIMQTELDGSRYSKSHEKAIERALKRFLFWANENSISDLCLITKKDIYNYQDYMLNYISQQTGKRLDNGTLSNMYNTVKMLFSALCRTGFLHENITSSIKFDLPKAEGIKRQAFHRNTMSKILEKMDVNSDIGLRNRALFELIYSSGLRVSEAAKLLIKDICLENREMIIRGKFSRDRLVPFSKMAHYYLALYLGNRVYNDREGPVFCNIRRKVPRRAMLPGSIGRIFTEHLVKHGMKKKELTTHSIRHTSATQLLDNGAGIRHVQELLGHRKIETTAGYTHTQNSKLAKIYRKYHPQEHDLFDAVDDTYKKRLEKVLGVKGIR